MENPSKETRKKLSESLTGEKNHKFGKPTPKDVCEKISEKLTGRKLPEEVCLKMSESRIGKKHPMWGQNHKEVSKVKMSLAKIGKEPVNKGTKVTDEEVLRKISESGKGRKWINDGNTSITAKGDTLNKLLDDGWVLGRLVPQQQKDRFSKSRVGKSPWNIGLKNTGGGRPKGSKNKK